MGKEPYYPVNDSKNTERYNQYKALGERLENMIFGGRLGEYKYYNMDAVVDSALRATKKEL